MTETRPTAAPAPTFRTFACPACAGTITLKAPGKSLSAVCEHCRTIVDTADENFRIIAEQKEKVAKLNPILALGTRGTFRGKEYEVIGFMRRCDKTAQFRWDEYLLFSPYVGFRWLIENRGHWSFSRAIWDQPKECAKYVQFKNKSYQLFTAEPAIVSAVLGEFYWRVSPGDEVHARDYINPPEMLSSEESEDEINWSIGEYVSKSEVERSFPDHAPMPQPLGIAPHQKHAFSGATKELFAFFFLLFVAMTFIQCASQFVAKDKTVRSVSGIAPAANEDPPENLSPPFELSGKDNVEVRLNADVSNSWLEASVALVNDDTDEAIEFPMVSEYYFGRDSDGAWTEGSRFQYRLFEPLPKGTYRLSYSAQAMTPTSYGIEVVTDVPVWSNYVFLLFIGLMPLFYFLRRGYQIEYQRWSNSDFAPAIYRSGDDD